MRIDAKQSYISLIGHHYTKGLYVYTFESDCHIDAL